MTLRLHRPPSDAPGASLGACSISVRAGSAARIRLPGSEVPGAELLWVGPMLHGSLVQDGPELRFTPPADFTGTLPCPYALRWADGRIVTGLLDFVVERGGGRGVGAWGPGPRSGDRWWTGFGPAPEEIGFFEEWRGRKCDILMYFAPHQMFKRDWDDIAGGRGDDETVAAGSLSLTKGVRSAGRIFIDHKELPAHFCLPLVPAPLGNQKGANPAVWDELAAGEHDGLFRRLGRRLAYLEAAHGRDPAVPLMLDLGWEHSGPWFPWSIAGELDGVPVYKKFPSAWARIVTSIREGYRAFAGRDCPYKFVWRPARKMVAPGVRHAAFYPGDEFVDLVSISVHENDPIVTADNWSSRWCPWPPKKPLNEGWDAMFELAQRRGKPVCFPEWSPHRVTEDKAKASPNAGEFMHMVRSYIEDHVEQFAYDTYFYAKPTAMVPFPDWSGSIAYRELWGATSG